MSRWLPEGMRVTPFMRALAIYSAASSAVGWIALHIPIAEPLARPLSYLICTINQLFHLQLWRVLTYVLVEVPQNAGALLQAILFTALIGFYLVGSQVEIAVGRRRTIELMAAGAISGVVSVLIGSFVFHGWRHEPLYGTGPVVGALFAGWGFAYATTPASIWPGLPTLTGKKLTWVLVGIFVVLWVLDGFDPGSFAYLGGMGGGALYMLVSQRLGRRGRSRSQERKRRHSGENLRVIRGGRGDRQMWN